MSTQSDRLRELIKNRPMSLIGHDILISKIRSLKRYALMPKEEKDKLQAEYISNLVQSLCDQVQDGGIRGVANLTAQPKQFYPYDKMIQDIKKALAKKNIKVTHIFLGKDRKTHRVVFCRFRWEKYS